jgi:hypothetical protein
MIHWTDTVLAHSHGYVPSHHDRRTLGSETITMWYIRQSVFDLRAAALDAALLEQQIKRPE